ncbi:bifunctional precorrin-2 dehydrogenase/sirohydrochlorin ferrochelatase [Paenibacillus tarimensis]
MIRYYPVMMNLEGALCAVVGGGTVAARKVEGLIQAGARVVVVSPEISTELRLLADVGSITVVDREYQEQDIFQARLVFAATNRREVNERVAEDAASLGIPVNVADRSETGTFILPSTVRRGGLVLAVTTSGASPALAGKIKRELEERYTEDYVLYTVWLRNVRERVIRTVTDEKRRRALLLEALDVPKSEWTITQDVKVLDGQIADLMRRLDGRNKN